MLIRAGEGADEASAVMDARGDWRRDRDAMMRGVGSGQLGKSFSKATRREERDVSLAMASIRSTNRGIGREMESRTGKATRMAKHQKRIMCVSGRGWKGMDGVRW